MNTIAVSKPTTEHYPDFEEVTGYGSKIGLCGYNCRHSFHLFDPSTDKPVYSPDALKSLNSKTVSYEGKRISVYEATQIQRSIERKIRQWKTKGEMAGAVGDEDGMQKAKLRVRFWQSEARKLVDDTGLQRQYAREDVDWSYKKDWRTKAYADRFGAKQYQ